jgi:GNAT superfamily N-acetyltransferase
MVYAKCGEKAAIPRRHARKSIIARYTYRQHVPARGKEMNPQGYPRKTHLRDGREVVLRPMSGSDASDLRRLFGSLPEREKLFVRDDDVNPGTVVRWPKEIDYERILPILGKGGESLVGIATLHHLDQSWLNHVGSIRVTVSPEWRRVGLGTVLVGELFKHSLQAGLEKIVTEIVKEQREVSLFYNSLGFHTEANLRDHFLDEKGLKHDVLIMSNGLRQLWKIWLEDSQRESGMVGSVVG